MTLKEAIRFIKETTQRDLEEISFDFQHENPYIIGLINQGIFILRNLTNKKISMLDTSNVQLEQIKRIQKEIEKI